MDDTSSAIPAHHAAMTRALVDMGVSETVARDAAAQALMGFLDACMAAADVRGLEDGAVAAMWKAADVEIGGLAVVLSAAADVVAEMVRGRRRC